MFGQNPIRSREFDPNRLQVREIFGTIQGEGPYAGHSSVFIRLTGCNLRCCFCDTKWSDETDPFVAVDDIVQKAVAEAGRNCRLAVITGGEPLRQDLSKLIPALLRHFTTVQIETAGTYWQPVLMESGVDVVVSPKTPKINTQINLYAKAFKYIVKADELGDDGLPIMSTQLPGKPAQLARPRVGAPVYLSPCDEYDPAKNAANLRAVVTAARAHGYIAGVQLHKIIGVD